jgi:hypothetical protein
MKMLLKKLTFAFIGLAAFVGTVLGNPPMTQAPMMLRTTGGCDLTPILLTTTGTSGTSQWTNSTGCTSFKIEVIAPGGSGGVRLNAEPRATGGAGGGYCRKNTVTLSGTGPWNYNIGAGGAGHTSSNLAGSQGQADTWFCNVVAPVVPTCSTILGSAVVVGAKFGFGGSVGTTAGNVSGASGGSAGSGIGDSCLSGGGSGGITGGSPNATGGGGAGGSTGSGTTSAATSSSNVSTAGGAGGTVSGGAGGASSGGAGSNGTLFDGTHGAGGGGGGNAVFGGTSGTPGNCGAGAGGAASTAGNPTTPAGADGCILITPLS